MIWPIYIPSKGRAGKSKLIDQLLTESIPFEVFLEIEDADKYLAVWPGLKIKILSKSNQGIAYVRNAILSYARASTSPWYWMFDDDITGFFISHSKRNHRSTARKVLTDAQQTIQSVPGAAQGSLEYQQFSWSQTKPLKLNSYCDVAVAINTNLLKTITYRAHMDLKEDRDFTLQVLSMGYMTVRCSNLAFAAPKNGSNAGGLQDVYAQAGREEVASQRMAEAWPGICSPITKPDGRKDVKINWSVFQTKP